MIDIFHRRRRTAAAAGALLLLALITPTTSAAAQPTGGSAGSGESFSTTTAEVDVRRAQPGRGTAGSTKRAAGAASTRTAVAAGVNLRPCVDVNNPVCAPVGTTSSTGIAKMRCWRDGSNVRGRYTSPRWFLVMLSDQREGYVHSSFVTNQVRTPACHTLAFVRAADKALSYYGQTYAAGDVANRYQRSDWAPGPFGEWSGDCAKLTSSAYRYGAGISYPSGNAIGQYQAFRNAGKILGGIPRYGTPVFYDIARPYGHTALYIGGTTIITTQGMDHDGLRVTRKGLHDYANYLGWGAAA